MSWIQDWTMLWHLGDKSMKMIVLLCWLASGQCEQMPWTGDPRGPHEGSPRVFKTQEECKTIGDLILAAHQGFPNQQPAYHVVEYRCE